MAQNFIGSDRNQSFLLPPDVRNWLPDGHLAWFVLDAVACMDLREFYASYREDGVVRRAYDPAMMAWSRCCCPGTRGGPLRAEDRAGV